MKMIPPDEFGNEVAQYDPITVVHMCANACREMDKAHQTLREGTLNGQKVVVTQHTFAELVMWAIRNHPSAGSKTPSPADVTRLANNIYSIQDPFLNTKAGGIMTLMRVAYEQFPYQEQLQYQISRHLVLYLESNPPQLSFDFDIEFRKVTGLTVKEFMMLGFMFYAATSAFTYFDRNFVENTKVTSLRPYVSPQNVDAFLAIAGIDFETFRNIRLEEEKIEPSLGRFTFNPLLSHPVIELPDGMLCVPVPRLLIYRITQGIYYDLLDAHSQPQGNIFSTWFGYAFQEYIGTILKDAFGGDNVYSEVAEVDWLVILEDTALVIECRSGRMLKKIRSKTNRDDVLEMIRRNIVDPAQKLPGKISKIEEGIPGIPTDKVQTYLPVIITYQEWYPTALTLDLARSELKHTDAENFHFELMSTDDIEWLLAWSKYENPANVLQEMRKDVSVKDVSVGQYVGVRAKRRGITKIDKTLLSKKRSEYLGEIFPESED